MAGNVGTTPCTDAQAEQRRRTEAKELIEQIEGHEDDMTVADADFFVNIKRWAYRGGSVRQLNWLRDIRDRYVLGTEEQHDDERGTPIT